MRGSLLYSVIHVTTGPGSFSPVTVRKKKPLYLRKPMLQQCQLMTLLLMTLLLMTLQKSLRYHSEGNGGSSECCHN